MGDVLGIGIWVLLLGYTGLVWGEKFFTGRPQSFAYLLGASADPGYAIELGQGSLDYLNTYALTVDEVHTLRVKAAAAGRVPGYYLPGGAGWRGGYGATVGAP